MLFTAMANTRGASNQRCVPQTNPKKFAARFQKPDRVTPEHVKQVGKVALRYAGHKHHIFVQLFAAVCDLVRQALYQNVSDTQEVTAEMVTCKPYISYPWCPCCQVDALLGSGLDERLKALVSQIVSTNM